MQHAYEIAGSTSECVGLAGPMSGDAWQAVTFGSETPYRSAATLFRLAALMHTAAQRARGAASWLDAWLDRRRVARAALDDLGTMSDRELLDIGLTRVDVNRVAWGASDRDYLQPEI
ncbi:MAG TPA: DUF1127 domain-containing protein [Casimicrobiaceae bacterium]